MENSKFEYNGVFSNVNKEDTLYESLDFSLILSLSPEINHNDKNINLIITSEYLL